MNILLSKVRVTPLNGGSVPLHELKSMVMPLRIAILATRAAPFKTERITPSTDSTSCGAALQRTGDLPSPLVANRAAEIQHTRAELSKPPGVTEKFTHVAGKLNPANLGTRPVVKMGEPGPGKLWQDGPTYLRQPQGGVAHQGQIGRCSPQGGVTNQGTRPLEKLN